MIHPRLNIIRTRRLIEVMKSDKYKHMQIRGCLRKTNSFDAQGLACHVSKLGRWEYRAGSKVRVYVLNGKEYITHVPQEVWDWYGFSTETSSVRRDNKDQGKGPRFGSQAYPRTLQYLNDEMRLPFWTIAVRLESAIKQTLALTGETEADARHRELSEQHWKRWHKKMKGHQARAQKEREDDEAGEDRSDPEPDRDDDFPGAQ